MLTAENYKKGFLMDEELMGGVAEEGPEALTTGFSAYVLRHTTGEYLGYRTFGSLADALSAINTVERAWKFENSSGCGQCKDGDCTVNRGGSCKMANKGQC